MAFEGEEIITAGEFIAREVLAEVEAAVASSKQCTAATRVAELEAVGMMGLKQPIYACKTCAAENGGSPVGVWCVTAQLIAFNFKRTTLR